MVSIRVPLGPTHSQRLRRLRETTPFARQGVWSRVVIAGQGEVDQVRLGTPSDGVVSGPTPCIFPARD